MFESPLPEVVLTQVLFWLLLPIVLWGRLHWAVLTWLVMSNFDGTGPSTAASTTEVGIINALKGVAIPIYLVWRMRHVPSSVQGLLSSRLWIATTLYAAIASFWSPFPLAATKLVANMAGIFLSIVVLEKAARSGLIDTKLLQRFVLATVALAAIQTFYFGGTAYGFDGIDQPARFSSFVAAQQFAALLVALLTAVLFWDRPMPASTRGGLLVVICLALALNGSRTWTLGAVVVLGVYGLFSIRRSAIVAISSLMLAAACCVALLDAMNTSGSILEATQSRIFATAIAVLSGEDTTEQAGLRTFTFRLGIYEGVYQELQNSSITELVIGHGTSSGASAALSRFPSRYSVNNIDPNRIIHNEWLRALFEWGVVGFGLLVSVFLGMGTAFFRPNMRSVHVAPLLAYLPALLTALTTENILAGAGNAVTMSFAFLTAMVWMRGIAVPISPLRATQS
jgi:hypothetical protein